jgi:pimeloyl-ACP methyl ester carboxylesterase
LNKRPGFARARACAAGVVTAAVLAACGGGGGDPAPIVVPEEPAAPQLPDVPENLSVNPSGACTMEGIGSVAYTADAPVTVLEVTTGTTTGNPARDKPYCLVKLKVDPQVNIWVSMPTSEWNGRFRAEGNGVYAGNVPGVANDSIRQGFVGVTTDTGHSGSPLSGSFGMAEPGKPNTQLQIDFAYRSEHLMAAVGKQVVKAYYGKDPVRSYWYGCSTGGRQGLAMAQRYPEDYDAILAGAPAIHWDRFQAYQIWPQVVYKAEGVTPLSAAKRTLVTSRAVTACDASDGITDGVIDDPRTCTYDPRQDSAVTTATCTSADGTCLSPAEARAVQRIWGGARNTFGDLLWPGIERGADLGALAGANPFPIPIEQARYWVYFDPTWDWNTLTVQNYEAFFNDNARMVGPIMATDNPDLSAFKARGGKLIMYHGWSDNLIMPQGTIRYYDAMKQTVADADAFSRLYMVPGMGHCSGGPGVNQFGQGSSGTVPMTASATYSAR